MLKENHIPNKEPSLCVGIILPQDETKKIQVHLFGNSVYSLSSNTVQKHDLKNKTLLFDKNQDSIHLDSFGDSNSWAITQRSEDPAKPKSGLLVKNIKAGRGFHWQKRIDVYLPGNIEIACAEGNLILVNELPLEQYLMCVATSEMSAKCPLALIEAQTIVARSWMLANVEQKHIHLGMDVCNDDCCQRYQGTAHLSDFSIQGTCNTTGQVLMYQNKICDARYSKSCGGIMETFPTIWCGLHQDYLQAIPDASGDFKHDCYPLNSEETVKNWINDIPNSFCSSISVPENSLTQYLGDVDEQGHYFRWQISLRQKEILDLLNRQLNLKANVILDLIPLTRGGSGRIIELKILFTDKENQKAEVIVERDFEIRRILHKGFLYSSCIYIEKKAYDSGIPAEFTIHGAGWGHGVGLCQIGALGMSLQDYGVAEILSHYYPGSHLVKIY
jgi:SpoIID/LytB domain protein